MMRPLDILFSVVLVLLAVSQVYVFMMPTLVTPRRIVAPIGAPERFEAPFDSARNTSDDIARVAKAPPVAGLITRIQDRTLFIDTAGETTEFEVQEGVEITLRELSSDPRMTLPRDIGISEISTGDQVLVLRNEAGEIEGVVVTRAAPKTL